MSLFDEDEDLNGFNDRPVKKSTKKEWPDSDVDSLNSDEMSKWAKNRSLHIVFPAKNELQIDIDTEQQLRTFTEVMEVARNKLDIIVSYKEQPSKTNDGFHYHMTVTLKKDIDDQTRILLQACLGSDPKRELLSYFRLTQGDPHPTMFAEQN